MGTCPPVTTPIYKVQTCLKETTQALNACSTKIITLRLLPPLKLWFRVQ